MRYARPPGSAARHSIGTTRTGRRSRKAYSSAIWTGWKKEPRRSAEIPTACSLLLEQVLDIKVKSSSLYLAHKDKRGYDPELVRRFRDLVEGALSQAKTMGRVRPDLTFETIELAFDMMAGALNSKAFEERLAIKDDILRICLDGIRLPRRRHKTPTRSIAARPVSRSADRHHGREDRVQGRHIRATPAS